LAPRRAPDLPGGRTRHFRSIYYLLKKIEATRVALITLITLLLALMLYGLLNVETLTHGILMGTAVILLGLVCFQYGDFCLMRLRRILFRA